MTEQTGESSPPLGGTLKEENASKLRKTTLWYLEYGGFETLHHVQQPPPSPNFYSILSWGWVHDETSQTSLKLMFLLSRPKQREQRSRWQTKGQNPQDEF